ncbi:4Fe-4S binding protein, partial [Salinispira pacifica]
MASVTKSDRKAQRKFRALRLAVLILMLALSTALGILHQASPSMRPVGVDALDPFGGIESAISLATTGELVEKIAWTSFVLLGATILAAVLFRRVFCGKICAFGTLQELFGKLGRKIFRRRFAVPARIDRPARYLKYLVLLFVVAGTVVTGELFIRPYDPWAAYHHVFSAELLTGFVVGLIILVVSVVGSLFYDRFFCKYLCPMGAFLGL